MHARMHTATLLAVLMILNSLAKSCSFWLPKKQRLLKVTLTVDSKRLLKVTLTVDSKRLSFRLAHA